MRTTLTILAALILTACGGGGSDEPTRTFGELNSSPYAAKPDECKDAVTVGLYGDSTMHSNGIAQQVMQAEFDRMFGAGRVTVTNFGIPGQIGWDAAQTMTPTQFDVSVANYGINDCGASMSAPAYRSALRLMLAKGLTAIETPNPVTHRDCTGYADAAVEVALAAGAAVVDTEAFVLAHGGGARLVDRIHPSADLYREIAAFRAQSLAPIVAARLCEVRS